MKGVQKDIIFLTESSHKFCEWREARDPTNTTCLQWQQKQCLMNLSWMRDYMEITKTKLWYLVTARPARSSFQHWKIFKSFVHPYILYLKVTSTLNLYLNMLYVKQIGVIHSYRNPEPTPTNNWNKIASGKKSLKYFDKSNKNKQWT